MSKMLIALVNAALSGAIVWCGLMLIVKMSFDLADLWERRIAISERRIRDAVDASLACYLAALRKADPPHEPQDHQHPSFVIDAGTGELVRIERGVLLVRRS